MVTAELAVAMPALVVVVVAAVVAVTLVTTQLRCVDAAGVAARLAARGDPIGMIQAATASDLPGAARVDVTMAGDLVTATVRTTVSAPGVLHFLPSITITSRVVAAREPTGSTGS